MKPFKTLEEQIQVLRSRHLSISDEQSVKNYLLSNNYYNIINGYGKYFLQSGDAFIVGTTFDEISRLYLFDKELKHAFFKAVIDAEAHLKAVFAYRFAETFPDKPYAYLNIDCYDNRKTLSVISTIAQLSQIINRQQKYSNSEIQHYIKTHNDVPIWVLVNHLNFGTLRAMVDASTQHLQNKIAKDLHGFITQHIPSAGKFPPETMNSFLENINELRNVCAHNNRLLGFECRQDTKYWTDLHCPCGIETDTPRRNVFSVFVSLQCFLSRIEFASLHNKILKLIHSHLEKHLHTISCSDVLTTLGFPPDWNHQDKIVYNAS